MAGVYPSVFWLSWLIFYLFVIFVVSGGITIFFYFFKTLSNINPLFIFLSIFFYGMSCCSLSFIFSYFFKNTKTAGPVVSIISVIIIMANMATSYVSLKIRKLVAIFLSPIYICSFIYKIDKMKSHNENLTFNNFIKSDSGYFLLILLANNILYYVLAIVLDIIDNAGGFKFFLLKSFLLKSFLLKGENECNIGYQDDYQKDIQDDETNKNKKCMVEVSGISKIFEKKKKRR
ncbi:hypothetical protein H8356DRAFT_628945 [Neocallimastix lanati (nom. inval.)]|nr:hypothetical protein H8356DRAFT_628945 [Neocallimastix sp. JGI-2020a]